MIYLSEKLKNPSEYATLIKGPYIDWQNQKRALTNALQRSDYTTTRALGSDRERGLCVSLPSIYLVISTENSYKDLTESICRSAVLVSPIYIGPV